MTHRHALVLIVLLAVIAMELAVIGVKLPTPRASAQSEYTVLVLIYRVAQDIRDDLAKISRGLCTNKTICP